MPLGPCDGRAPVYSSITSVARRGQLVRLFVMSEPHAFTRLPKEG
jgi:hypothetical protein